MDFFRIRARVVEDVCYQCGFLEKLGKGTNMPPIADDIVVGMTPTRFVARLLNEGQFLSFSAESRKEDMRLFDAFDRTQQAAVVREVIANKGEYFGDRLRRASWLLELCERTLARGVNGLSPDDKWGFKMVKHIFNELRSDCLPEDDFWEARACRIEYIVCCGEQGGNWEQEPGRLMHDEVCGGYGADG